MSLKQVPIDQLYFMYKMGLIFKEFYEIGQFEFKRYLLRNIHNLVFLQTLFPKNKLLRILDHIIQIQQFLHKPVLFVNILLMVLIEL